jgi:hypothetical protein
MKRLLLAAVIVAAPVLGMATPSGAQSCDSHYPDFCIPPPPPDLDCPQIGVANFTANQPDPHHFDADKDGTGCDDAAKARDAITDPNGIGAKAIAGQTATTTATTVATTQATTATTSAPVVQTNAQATTPTTALPHTGARENDEAALGLAVLLAGVLAVVAARPRIAAALARPLYIEQERIDRAHKLLGWSDGWDEHLRRKQ